MLEFNRRQAQREIMQAQYIDRIASQQQIVFTRAPIVNANKLVEILEVDIGTQVEDLDAALYAGQCLSPSRQIRAGALMQHPQFNSWVTSSHSAALVVNGREPRGTRGIMSPLTYFTALFSRTLSGVGTALPIVFICGRHAIPGDGLEGAQGMMRALISQILAHYGDNPDLSFLTYDYLEQVKAQEINHLCHLFRSLLTSIAASKAMTTYPGSVTNSDAVFCLLDGVSFLETEARADELHIAIDCLRSATMEVDAFGGRFAFKVVLLYPTMSQYAQDWFPEESILTMREQVAAAGYAHGQLRMVAASNSLLMQ